ncbi:sugar transferase [Aliiroseovarius subalbicans]|uniref:sugar transferase n=1 Tax=Aliiroseovarius subalbicans TaxID=2925840 RepID=UPI001F5A5D24|nr:sugar transferase [Aliiroseovarius subalbicans]MCI2397800.1 sugar transferase [Aliiroseovarius subalbicans]
MHIDQSAFQRAIVTRSRRARLLDIAVSVMALALTGPLLVIAALGIKLSSPGPIFFVSDRVGRGGHAFRMVKLRTLHCHAPGSFLVGAGDARLFPFGRLLRKTRLDEVPQFLNVLRGDMALVGPRPRVHEVADRHYIDWMTSIMNYLPGMTSPGTLYQVTIEDKTIVRAGCERFYGLHILPRQVMIDLSYLDTATLRSDLVVIATTLWILVQHAAGRVAHFPERYRVVKDRTPLGVRGRFETSGAAGQDHGCG